MIKHQHIMTTFYTTLGYTGGEFHISLVLRMESSEATSRGHLWMMAGRMQNTHIGLAPMVSVLSVQL